MHSVRRSISISSASHCDKNSLLLFSKTQRIPPYHKHCLAGLRHLQRRAKHALHGEYFSIHLTDQAFFQQVLRRTETVHCFKEVIPLSGTKLFLHISLQLVLCCLGVGCVSERSAKAVRMRETPETTETISRYMKMRFLPSFLGVRVKVPFTVRQWELSPPQTPHLSSTLLEPISLSQPTFCRGKSKKTAEALSLVVSFSYGGKPLQN